MDITNFEKFSGYKKEISGPRETNLRCLLCVCCAAAIAVWAAPDSSRLSVLISFVREENPTEAELIASYDAFRLAVLLPCCICVEACRVYMRLRNRICLRKHVYDTCCVATIACEAAAAIAEPPAPICSTLNMTCEWDWVVGNDIRCSFCSTAFTTSCLFESTVRQVIRGEIISW